MTTNTAVMACRKTLFSRTLVLTALFVVAAAGSVFCARSARADAPAAPKEDVSVEAQAVASLLAAQGIGNPAMGVSAMQVLWGGGIKPEPPKSQLFAQSGEGRVNRTPAHPAPPRPIPRTRKTASAKSE